MNYIGLLTHQQKQAGYFVTQDEDFVWLWWGRNGSPDCISIFLYPDVKVRDIREFAEKHRRGMAG